MRREKREVRRGGGLVTIRYKADVFTPSYRKFGVFACALKANRRFLHRCVPTEDLFLLVPEGWTGFYQVDLLDA